jgi:hypothetical protein
MFSKLKQAFREWRARHASAREWPLETMCDCGHTYGAHKAVPLGKPSPCKSGHHLPCECRAFIPADQTQT